MADFRRLLTALALVALFVGLASAQGVNTVALTCAQGVSGIPTVRSEGFTELTGDILFTCTGGQPLATGVAIPVANITVTLNTAVTSRVLSTANGINASEALLLIDEPGSASVTGYGPGLPQSPCPQPGSIAGCPEVVGTTQVPAGTGPIVAGVMTNAGSLNTTSQISTPGYNVFQGVITGTNQVTFFGVPVLPPSSAGISRIFRFTNIRANANGVNAGGVGANPITASVSATNGLLQTNFTFTVANVQSGLTTSLRKSDNSAAGGTVNVNQCSSASFGTTGAAGILRYTENFATAFKTRAAVGQFQAPGNTTWTNTNPFTATGATAGAIFQNIPGQVYNAESGFVLPLVSGGGGIAGVADWGTRLKAVFSNIPSGVSIYVSTLNVANLTTAFTTAGAATASLLNSETVGDTNGFLPTATVTNTTSTGSVTYTALTVNNGTAVATWEVTANNYTSLQSLDFGVFISYSAAPQNNVPAPGPMSVNMSYAPNATNGAFSATNATNPASVNMVPRYADTSKATTFAQVNICQTVLLYPFVVTNTGGFETGMAVSNTTQDPFGTNAQTGSCTFNWFQAGTAGTNPAAGTSPAIPGGTTYSFLASSTTVGVGSAAFTGYMFAVCNFQYAHGYAAITDVGARGILSSYLALVVPTGTGGRTSSAESFSH